MRHTTQESNQHAEIRVTAPNRAVPNRHHARPSRVTRGRGVAVGGFVLAAALATGGLTAVHLMSPSSSAGSAGTAAAGLAGTAGGVTDGTDLALTAHSMPQLAVSPHIAALPGHKVKHKTKVVKKKPAPAKSPTASAAPTSSASAPGAPSIQPTAPAGMAPTTSAPPASAPAGASATCTSPQFTTSDPTAMWNQDPYFVANDMWGISGYSVSQTLSACSPSNWYVTATMNNNNGDGHVKTYPNSHRDFDNEPVISSLSSITSTFAETDPGTGIYEDAYDIWLNGIADSGSTEVMIWTNNHGQTPSGSVQTTVTIDGHSYTVWRDGTYIAFVANSSFSSGTMNLLAFFQWIQGKGWLTSSATLGQVDYGAELVSTNNVPETFGFSNFTVNTG